MKKFKIYIDKFRYINIKIHKTRKKLRKHIKQKKWTASHDRMLRLREGKILAIIGEINFSLEDMNISTIAHECLHSAIYYFTVLFNTAINIPSEFWRDEKSQEFEERFISVYENIFSKIFKGLKKNGIKIKGF